MGVGLPNRDMKYALVTGGGRGIGRAISIRLAAMGYTVVINYRNNAAAANETLRTITEAGGKAELLKMDVSNGESVRAAMDTWEASHEGEHFEVLVNNAGVRNDSLMVFMEDEKWHSVVDVTLNGFYFLTRRLLQPMLLARKGRIVNITSVSGIDGIPGQTNYSAAKAAMIGATRALSKEVAARGVTVNAVAPGFITTEMTADIDPAVVKATVPAKRMGKPEEVAAVVAFLVSDEAAYVTGETIKVAGGL